MVDQEQVSGVSRQLAALLEPVAGQVYFSPECHKEYEALGFAPSRGKAGDVELPDGPAYFTSRGSVMGKIPGELVAAAFGVFNPAAVIPAVTYGWSLTDDKTICEARTRGATAQLERILTNKPEGIDRVTEILMRACDVLRPEGRPLYSGLRSLGLPGDPVGDVWRLADQLREFRGDAHTAAWISAGIDATEINLLTEAWMGLPARSYSRTRAWSDDEFDAAEERLRSRGWFDENGIAAAGQAARAVVENATDAQMTSVVEAIAPETDELFALLEPWGIAIRAQGGYLAAGPHDLAKAALGG
jgi:hypothetical protein